MHHSPSDSGGDISYWMTNQEMDYDTMYIVLTYVYIRSLITLCITVTYEMWASAVNVNPLPALSPLTPFRG